MQSSKKNYVAAVNYLFVKRKGICLLGDVAVMDYTTTHVLQYALVKHFYTGFKAEIFL